MKAAAAAAATSGAGGGVLAAKIAALQSKIAIVERFVRARSLAGTQPEGMVDACKQLLQLRDLDEAVRVSN